MNGDKNRIHRNKAGVTHTAKVMTNMRVVIRTRLMKINESNYSDVQDQCS